MLRLSLLTLLLLSVAHLNGAPLPRHGFLGIPLRPAPADVREKLNLGLRGAVQVAASANGLLANDVVVGIAGKSFKTPADFSEMLRGESLKASVTLNVIRDGKEMEIEIHFQPKPLDNTDTYETNYDEVVSRGHRIRLFVTKPKAAGPHPVFFYIQGINTGSVDFPLSTKNYIGSLLRPFADDFVTVRVEKPGVGDSEGGPAKLVGFDEESDIYRQTLKKLATYDFVDRGNIFIFGHSMGGCHAPLVGNEVPVRGAITYGTVSNSWLEWEIRSPRIEGPLEGKTRAQIDGEVRQITAFYNYVYNEKRSIEWIKKNRPELRKFAEEQSPDGVMLGDRSVKYMQEVNDHNFCEAWSKLGSVKVLALFGENDWISLREDQTQVADAVNATNPGHAEFEVVPGSDHIFNRCKSMQDSYDHFVKPGTEFNPAIIEVVKQWIAKQAR